MSEIGTALARELGPDRVAEDAATLTAHQVDYWILAHLRARQGRLDGPPACVVRPQSTAEVAAAVRIAQRHGVAIVPYGGGSGVLGGAVPPAGSLVIDTRAMHKLLELNDAALWVRVQAGMMGGVYEATLAEQGYTGGHFPQSIDLATIGGLVATRSAGQLSTRYGNIEDLCLGLEAVLASGDVVRVKAVPRSSTGPSLRELFLGSEGALGIVTEATLRIFPKAEHRAMETYAFPTMAAGLEAIRKIVRVGWRPAVVRLYDAVESARNFTDWAPADQCLLLVLSEGPRTLVDAEMAACAAACAGAVALGAKPVEHWLGHRNVVPSWDTFLDREMLVDTIEIAAGWDRIGGLYDAVVASLQGVPGLLVGSAHSSHSYPQGTNLYITFAMKPPDFADAEKHYLDAWGRVMRASLDAGGTIAHHHGIGRLRAEWLREELGTAYPLLLALKRALDPAGLMNPGTLVARG
jgi:alkyldihydroxyacetonephosphate synthase